MSRMRESAAEENLLSAIRGANRGRELGEEVANAAAYLSNIADQLDAWAEESKTGGWSTHQVHGNINMANSCRRMAAKLRHSII
jgi:hypothetical protein